MKHYVTSVCIFTTTLIFIICICVLSCSAKMTAFLMKKQDSLIVSRGEESLDEAEKIIVDDFREKVFKASREAYITLNDIVYDEDLSITEDEALALYRKITLRKLKDEYGNIPNGDRDGADQLRTGFSSLLPDIKTGILEVSEYSNPYLELVDDEIYLRDVLLTFSYGGSPQNKAGDIQNPGNSQNSGIYYSEKEFGASAKLDDIFLFDENEEVFGYSMVADKGIYITGKTSTIIGNIYAGTHGPAELRKSEALYGESESYGGLNIMSTQIAIEADKIVTDGNVNLKGAFTVFGSEERPVEICAKDIHENDNIANKNIYALFGGLSDRSIEHEMNMAADAMRYFGSIELYYDTNNDRSYRGSYRKILSSTDLTITEDITGVIMTPGSVIIEEGVNVEGLILSGDRIYIQGNNNIVASKEILRDILKEELYGNIYSDDVYDTDEERALNSIHLYMKDYLGGIQERGFICE